MKSVVLGFALTLLGSAQAFAGASPVVFTEQEIADNVTNAPVISEAAAACLNRTWTEHNEFYAKRKYSKFYGSRNPKYKTVEGRKAALLKLLPELAKKVKKGDAAAIAELDMREKELSTTSCVGLAIKCLGEGFKAANMNETWTKIMAYVGRSDASGTPMFYGTDLQKALVDLGWKSLYWNPDISRNQTWDELERAFNPLENGKEWNPVWGGHVERWTSVSRKKGYYGIPVTDIRTLVNFGVTPPAEFKKPPFFVGTAHAGYHVFPGFNGNVIEAHSMREMGSKDNMEVGQFNPLYQKVNGVAGGNGAPKWTRSEHYRSGVIVVPPGYISEKPFTVPGAAVNTPPDGTVPPDAPRDDNGGWNNPNDPRNYPGNNPGWNQPPTYPPAYPPYQPEPRRRNCFWPFCR
jgi:hypothetical protein